MSELKCIYCESENVAVARDMLSTRHCCNCHRKWLPDMECGWTKPTYKRLETELAQLREKCAEYEGVLKSIDTDTEIDEQDREWRMDKDDMRIMAREVLEKWKGKGLIGDDDC